MAHYREVLYRNYSRHFGGRRANEPEVGLRDSIHHVEYDQVYGAYLPDDRDAVSVDLGCGQGAWLAWLQSRGFSSLLGVDVSAEELAACPDVPVEVGDACEVLQGYSGHFDLIHAKDIIEHLTKQEVIDLLSAARQALRPGGQIWLNTFNAQALFAEAIFHADFTHESAFTAQSLAQALRATGFEIVVSKGFQAAPTRKAWIRRLIWSLSSKVFGFLLTCGYGNRAKDEVDSGALQPGLLAVARRPLSDA